MAAMINGIHHVGLTVSDANAASKFYSQAAYMTTDVASRLSTLLPLEQQHVRVDITLRSANAYLRLLEVQPTKPQRQDFRQVSEAGIVHICMQSPNMPWLYEQFQNCGASFHAPPVDLGTGFLYSYSRDLEHNVVELEGVPPVWDNPTPWIAHVSFSTSNIDRLTNFYSKLLGHPAARSPRFGPHPRMDAVSGMKNTEFMAAWIPCTNMQVEVIQYFSPPTTPHMAARSLTDLGYSYVCFEVAHIESALQYALSQGAEQSTHLVKMSTSHSAFCTDPDGNLLLLLVLGEDDHALKISALPDPTVVSRMTTLREKLNSDTEKKATSR